MDDAPRGARRRSRLAGRAGGRAGGAPGGRAAPLRLVARIVHRDAGLRVRRLRARPPRRAARRLAAGRAPRSMRCGRVTNRASADLCGPSGRRILGKVTDSQGGDVARPLTPDELTRYPWASQISDYVPVGRLRTWGLLLGLGGLVVRPRRRHRLAGTGHQHPSRREHAPPGHRARGLPRHGDDRRGGRPRGGSPSCRPSPARGSVSVLLWSVMARSCRCSSCSSWSGPLIH